MLGGRGLGIGILLVRFSHDAVKDGVCLFYTFDGACPLDLVLAYDQDEARYFGGKWQHCPLFEVCDPGCFFPGSENFVLYIRK